MAAAFFTMTFCRVFCLLSQSGKCKNTRCTKLLQSLNENKLLQILEWVSKSSHPSWINPQEMHLQHQKLRYQTRSSPLTLASRQNGLWWRLKRMTQNRISPINGMVVVVVVVWPISLSWGIQQGNESRHTCQISRAALGGREMGANVSKLRMQPR